MRNVTNIPWAPRVKHLWAVLFFTYFFLFALKPLSDPDLWLHLNTGRWIVQNGALPSGDPFTFTSPEALPESQIQGMRSQWLGQVLFYLVYGLGGQWAISVFRAMLIVFPFVALYLVYTRKGINPFLMLSIFSLPLLLIMLSLYYAFERPQAFSFILALCTAEILRRLGEAGARKSLVALLMFVMALWSNLHGMFIFGVAMIMAYGAGLLVEAAAYRSARRLSLLPPLVLGVLASCANPNTYEFLASQLKHFLARAFGSSAAGGGGVEILEFKPLLYFYREYHYVWPLFMAAFMGVAVFTLAAGYAGRKKIEFPEALVFSLFVFFGFYFARGATLAMLALSFFMLVSLRESGRYSRLVSGGLTAILSLWLIVITVQRTPMHLVPRASADTVHETYPANAVRFLKENDIQGRMFNDLLWGGYLGWRLYPEYKVFMDGRFLGSDAREAYESVMGAREGWQGILDEYGVNFILIRAVLEERGVVFPVVLKFIEDEPPGWRLVFAEGNSAMILRDSPENRGVIRRFGLPFDVLYVPMLQYSENLLRTVPGHPEALLTRAIALYGLGRREEARNILTVLPRSPLRDRYLRLLEGRPPA